MNEYELNKRRPTFEVEVDGRVFREHGYRIQIMHLHVDQLYFGLSFILRGEQVNYWKEFKRSDPLNQTEHLSIYL